MKIWTYLYIVLLSECYALGMKISFPVDKPASSAPKEYTLTQAIQHNAYVAGKKEEESILIFPHGNCKIHDIDAILPLQQAFRHLRNITTLVLSHHNLQEAHLSLLFQLPDLRRVSLDHNQIQQITSEDTQAIPSNSFIDLTGNQITHFHINEWMAKENVKVVLKKNPISYDYLQIKNNKIILKYHKKAPSHQ